MKYLKQKDERGFTLVEIAIVLVIIGLLLGGVLKGQALVQQARVKNIISTIDGLRAATMGFYDRYGQLPGDENMAGIPDGDGNEGNRNGQINNPAEAFMLYEDLQLAGFISGSYNGTTDYLAHAFGDQIWLYWVNPPGPATPTNHWFRLDNLPWEVALEIDLKLDDGDRNTGSVVASENYVPASANIGQVYILL